MNDPLRVLLIHRRLVRLYAHQGLRVSQVLSLGGLELLVRGVMRYSVLEKYGEQLERVRRDGCALRILTIAARTRACNSALSTRPRHAEHGTVCLQDIWLILSVLTFAQA